MAPLKARNTGYLVLVGCVVLALVSGLISLQPYGTPLNWVTRGAALLGYLAIFLSIISSGAMRQLVRFFGRPFVRVHHILSVSGLILITLHPLSVAWSSASLRVFLPRFGSWLAFLQWGGPPAWYLLHLGSLAAVQRQSIGRNWRTVHLLNYVAFLLGTIHATLIGTDFQSPIAKAVAVALAIVIVAIFVRKRFRGRRQ